MSSRDITDVSIQGTATVTTSPQHGSSVLPEYAKIKKDPSKSRQSSVNLEDIDEYSDDHPPPVPPKMNYEVSAVEKRKKNSREDVYAVHTLTKPSEGGSQRGTMWTSSVVYEEALGPEAEAATKVPNNSREL